MGDLYGRLGSDPAVSGARCFVAVGRSRTWAAGAGAGVGAFEQPGKYEWPSVSTAFEPDRCVRSVGPAPPRLQHSVPRLVDQGELWWAAGQLGPAVSATLERAIATVETRPSISGGGKRHADGVDRFIGMLVSTP